MHKVRNYFAVLAILAMGAMGAACTPPAGIGDAVQCYRVDAVRNDVAQMRADGHTVDYTASGWWVVDGKLNTYAAAEDDAVSLCVTL